MATFGFSATFGLSKSRILSHRQCAKRLWLQTHGPVAEDYDAAVEHRFAVGHRVTELAREQHPGGVLIEFEDDLKQALRATDEALAAGAQILFEPAFQHDGVLVRADIMVRRDRRWHVSEVKSSTHVKDYHQTDLAVQAWVMRNAGIDVGSLAIRRIDNAFVYAGDGRYAGLLTEVPMDATVTPLIEQVPKWVAEARATLEGPEPGIDIGTHCRKPFACPFYDHCEAQQPRAQYPVELLPNARKIVDELLAEGYRDLRDVPEGRIDTPRLERVRRITASGKPELDPRARETLATKGWPRNYLDFETIQFAIPIWAGTRPYQALPFQWSCHVQHADGRVEHREFLDLSGEPPLTKFLMTLLEALGHGGPVFVWSPFERTQLEALQQAFPDSAPAVQKVIKRLVDLLPLTRNAYYHPDMRGSWSIKHVLPTMDPSLSYDDLDEVQEGGGAMLAYLEAIDGATSEARREEIRAALLSYCKRDTEALMAIAKGLGG